MPPARRARAHPAAEPRLYTFTRPATAANPATVRAGRRRSNSSSPAKFTLFQAKYTKGDYEGQLTGNIYFRGKPRYGDNEKFKELFNKLTLAERLRWNDELKLYTVKVYTATQARLMLKTMGTLASVYHTHSRPVRLLA